MPDYKAATVRAARKYGVRPDILLALIQQESGFNPHARSGMGAQGIAQFMPGTAPGYGVNLHDNRVTDDLEGAAKYIKANLKRTGGDYKAALSIYNSGRPDAYKDPGFAKGQTYNYVRSILSGAKGFRGSGRNVPGGGRGGSVGSSTRTTTTTTPGVNREGDRKRLMGMYLLGQLGDIGTLKAQLDVTQDTPGTTSTSRIVTRGAVAGRKAQGPIKADGPTARLIDRANAIDSKHLPYQWGGGHAGKVNPYKATPLDCSGAVSSVLGINPRVSGEFTKWGKAGRAPKGKGVTVYANGSHVLMEIDGHFFGTSGSNKGGGAGWIPRAKIPESYLSGFTARHG